MQEDDFGCGVACVADLLDIPYSAALKLFNDSKNARFTGFLCRDIMTALQRAEVNSEYKYVKPKIKARIYRAGTIVFVAKGNKYPAGHYLLRKDRNWADSWINFPKIPRKSGSRKKLPGKPIYAIFLVQ